MSKRPIYSRCMVLMLAIPWLCGCGREAIDFNQQVTAIHARLGKAVEEFGRVVHPAIEEAAPPTPEAFHDASERLRQALTDAQQASKAIQAPDLSRAAELVAAQREFLAAEQQLLKAELPALQKLLEDQSLTPKGLEEVLKSRLAAMRSAETKLLTPLHAAQRQFAEAHGLKLASD